MVTNAISEIQRSKRTPYHCESFKLSRDLRRYRMTMNNNYHESLHMSQGWQAHLNKCLSAKLPQYTDNSNMEFSFAGCFVLQKFRTFNVITYDVATISDMQSSPFLSMQGDFIYSRIHMQTRISTYSKHDIEQPLYFKANRTK